MRDTPYTLEEVRAALKTPAAQKLDPYFRDLLEFLAREAENSKTVRPELTPGGADAHVAREAERYGSTAYTYTKADLELLKECVESNTTLRGALIAFQSVKKCSHEDLVELWLDFAEKFRAGGSVNAVIPH